jgi:hypothetical protein
MTTADESIFWELIEELQLEDPRVEEGTIMGGRGARVAGEFLGLVDFKGSGLVVKLPKARLQELIDEGAGHPFAPARRVRSGQSSPSQSAMIGPATSGVITEKWSAPSAYSVVTS